MGKDTIRCTRKLYPRSAFIQFLYPWHFMILKTTYFTGYADDSMPFVVGDDTTDALKAFEENGKNLRKWF